MQSKCANLMIQAERCKQQEQKKMAVEKS